MKVYRNVSYWMAAGALSTALLMGCDPVEPEETNARFTATQDETDPLTFTFDNVSTGTNNTYAWEFGDGNTSTEESPSHTYAAEGEYDVKLTATGDTGPSERVETIAAVDPLSQLKKLTGETSKTWKLVRETTSLWVGGSDGATWFALGPDATKPETRACAFNDEWTFTLEGLAMTYNSNGDIYAEGGEYGPWDIESGCYDVTEANAFDGKEGDLSAWGDGTHTFEYDTDESTLTLNGMGAWIALQKVTTGAETFSPVESSSYQVIQLTDVENGVDTLRLQVDVAASGGTWVFTLVSYDNPADEPDLPDPPTSDKALEANDIFDAFTGVDSEANVTWGTGEVTGWTLGVANPAAGETFTVGQYDKGDGGNQFENIQVVLDHRMDLSTRNVFTMRVYFPSSNDYTTIDGGAQDWADPKHLAQTVSVKLQDNLLGGEAYTTQAEVKVDITDAQLDTWVDVTFDFSAYADRTDFDKIVIQLGGEGQGRPGTFYLSDFQLNQ